jgi:predicted DNA-binding transcriptional regulator YafY
MNRLDRLYALVEELRAAGTVGRSARRLAERFEVSVRTIERDILALQEAGVPISAQLGRRGGYVLDRSMTLPPLNFSPAEAVAMAVGLRRLDETPWARDARTALLKVIAAMPADEAARARTLADGVRLLVQPLSPPDQAIADAVVRAVEEATPILIDYLDVGSRPTIREVEPHHVVLGPNGSYVTGWCRLRQDERVFRIDRIRSVQPLQGSFQQPVREYPVEDYETRAPGWE